MIHLLWSTLVLGIRAGLYVSGLVASAGVGLGGRACRFLIQEGVRIYSRHQMEGSPLMGPLYGALAALGFNLGLGLTIIWTVSLLHGLAILVVSLGFWLGTIEYFDIRSTHATSVEDYLLPWK